MISNRIFIRFEHFLANIVEIGGSMMLSNTRMKPKMCVGIRGKFIQLNFGIIITFMLSFFRFVSNKYPLFIKMN